MMCSQIKSKHRVDKFAEVFTAEREVKAMCDLISQEQWENIDTTFLEPACGNGAFVSEIYSRKLNYCNTYKDALRALKSITAIDIQADNVEETKVVLLKLYNDRFSEGFDAAKEILNTNIICGNSLEIQERWYKDELKRDIGTLVEALIEKVTTKSKPDKNGKIVSVIEWHDDCSLSDYLKSALEVHKGIEMLDNKVWGTLSTAFNSNNPQNLFCSNSKSQ